MAQPDPHRAERMGEVVRLRVMGLTFEQISDQVGVAKSTAHEDYRLAMKLWNGESVHEARHIEGARFDAALRSAWAVRTRAERGIPMLDGDGQTIVDGDGKLFMIVNDDMVLKACREIVHIETARCRLLGLNAPQQVELMTGVEVTDVADQIREKMDVEYERRKKPIPAVLSGEVRPG